MAIKRKPTASNFFRGRINSQTMGATARSLFTVMGGFCGGLGGGFGNEFTVWLEITDNLFASFYVDCRLEDTCPIGQVRPRGTALNCLSRAVSGSPRPLKIEASQVPGNVDCFADEIEARHFAALHRFRRQ